AEEMPRGRLRRAMLELAQSLERGGPLEQAIATHEAKIPPHLRGLVKTGIRSEWLGELFSRDCAYARVGTEPKRALRPGLRCPVLTSAIALALFIFVCVVVASQFEVIYRDFGVPIPRATLALLTLASAVRSTWSILPLLALIGVGAWLAARVFLTAARRRSLA